MPIGWGKFGKLEKLLSDGVHSVNLPAFFREYGIDDSRSLNNLRLKGHNELQLSIVRVRPINLGCRGEESKIPGLCLGEQVACSSQNGRLKVKSAEIPCVRQLVTPYA